jgi:NodT family efflux transporter outer membrane factor (OMF) lipoprotein
MKLKTSRPLQRLIPGLALLLVAGCADMSGLSTSAQLQDAASVRVHASIADTPISPAAWPSEKWWEQFHDPALNALMEEALAGNIGLRIAQARVRQSLAAEAGVEAAQLPLIGVQEKSIQQRFSGRSTVPKPLAGTWNSFNEATLSFNYELDFWNKNEAALGAALGRVQAAQMDAAAARLLLSTAVAKAYLQLQNASELKRLAQQSLHQKEQLLGLTRQRLASGIDSRVAEKQAEANLPATRDQIAALDETISLAKNQLAALLGKGPDRGLAIEAGNIRAATALSLPTDLPAELIGRRPDVLAQRLRVEALAGDIKVARTQFYPNISLTAFIGFQSLGLSNLFTEAAHVAGIGPAISLPVFNSARLRSNLAGKNAEYDAAVEQYNDTVLNAIHDVVNQLVSLRSLQQQRSHQEQALATAREARDLAVTRYRHGITGYLQVISAEDQLLAQMVRGANLDAKERELAVNMARALGGGVAGNASL